MRKHNMMHRDLKPQNLLISNDVPKAYPKPLGGSSSGNNLVGLAKADSKGAAAEDLSLTQFGTVVQPPILKIADFGFARHIGPQSLVATLCGSPLYMVRRFPRLILFPLSKRLYLLLRSSSGA
jgi:serine/threonine-protein kinase ULK/ATG1